MGTELMPEKGGKGQIGEAFRKQNWWDSVTVWERRVRKKVKDNCKISGWVTLLRWGMPALGGKILN